MVFILAIVVIVVVLIAVVAGKQAHARREALRLLAEQLGWRFDPDPDYSHHERYQPVDAFRRGQSRQAYNTLTGVIEVEGRPYAVKMGDYLYKTRSRDSKGRTKTHTHRFSYALFELPFASTPELAVRPEAFFDRMSAFFGFDDIDFESVEFSRRFHVKSADKRFAYDLIDPRMMEFLLTDSPPTIEVDSGYCCLTHGSKVWSPEEFQAALTWAEHFFQRWPKHLTDRLEQHATSFAPSPDS